GLNLSNNTLDLKGAATLTGNLTVSATGGLIDLTNFENLVQGQNILNVVGTITMETGSFLAITGVATGDDQCTYAEFNGQNLQYKLRNIETLTWSGASGNWLGAKTWKNATGQPTQFGVGDRAIFDSTGAASQTISILGIVLSKGITVSGSTNYTFSGSGNFVGDKMTLVKDGTGKLTISTNNDRLSNSITTVNQGTLLLTSVNALGKGGSLTVNTGATVQTEGTALGILSGQTIDINGGGAVAFNATSDMTLSGGITGAGDIRKSGGSNLFITGTNNNFAGTLRLQGGITVVGAANTSSGGADATLGANANIIVESGASFRTHFGQTNKTFNFANAYIKSGGSFGNIDGHVNETGNLHFNVDSIGTDGVITYNAIGTSTLYQYFSKNVGLNGIISGQGTVNVIAEVADSNNDHRFILRNAGNTFNGVY
ncbi:MAG: hypothetical protein RSB25_20890, partial [Acinetobacter sp.]